MVYTTQPVDIEDTDKVTTFGHLPGASLAAGTRIATMRGEVPVETLRIGDLVTVLGALPRPVIRTGRRRIDCACHGQPETLWPIRVAAGAFAPGLPKRDLFLAPDHAIFAEEVLIPAGMLANGSTVAPTAMTHVVYVDVALDRHSIIYAEGLAVENARWRADLTAHEAITAFEDILTSPHIDAGLPIQRLRGRLARRAVMQTVRDMLDADIAQAKIQRHSV